MSDVLQFPETLQEAVVYFSSEVNALEFMKVLRWPDGVVTCPACSSVETAFMASRSLWRCKGCRKQFSAKVGTVFEDSPLSLCKWLPAVWVIVNAKNGVSSCELARSLGVTQKTAWFMLHRIRLAMQASGIVNSTFSGVVEVDESFIGGKARNMHPEKKRQSITGTGHKNKTAVMGLLERSLGSQRCSRVKAHVVGGTKRAHLDGHIQDGVAAGSEIHSDTLKTYANLKENFDHYVVDHAECYVKDGVHTNGLENFWSLLKRTIKGTYVSVEPFHLFRYLSEQVFRFNERKHEDGDMGRFLTAIAGIIGKRLTYKKLIGSEEGGLNGLPVQA